MRGFVRIVSLAACLLGCGSVEDAVRTDARAEAAPVGALAMLPADGTFALVDARALDGTTITIAVVHGAIVAEEALPSDAPRIDAHGGTLVPAFVDAHVHLSYAPLAEAHAAGGIAVAVDLAAPLETLGDDDGLLTLLRAGPMITRPRGYPLDSWGHADADGHGGYGIACDDVAGCTACVDTLVDAGADVIKVAVLDGTLEGPLLDAVVTRAHARDRLVLAHALSDATARRAALAGVDVLAHAPASPLAAETVRALEGRAVVSTLSAFGARAAVDNVRVLREAGVTILYGTDLGNTRTAGIDPAELALLGEAGLDVEAIVEAATTAPARVFGLARHGALTPGHAASFLWFRVRPSAPTDLARPDAVVLDGQRRR